MRLVLILDCYVSHDFSPEYGRIISMQNYVTTQSKLPESEAIRIFCKVVEIVEKLHKLNVIHRDIKLGNIILNKNTGEVTLANFFLGERVNGDTDLLKDRRGSPAYLAPEIISGKPYLAKPVDLWSLGMVLYAMLFGKFAFYHSNLIELFRKIKIGHFEIPVDVNVSQKTVELINSLLVVDPEKRITASDALQRARSIILSEQSFMGDAGLQVVPDCHAGAERPPKRSYTGKQRQHADIHIGQADIASVLAACQRSVIYDEDESQPKKAKPSESSNFPAPISHLCLNKEEVVRLHVMFVARKILEAAANGALSVRMITEELTNQLSNNDAINTITLNTRTDNDSVVPTVSL